MAIKKNFSIVFRILFYFFYVFLTVVLLNYIFYRVAIKQYLPHIHSKEYARPLTDLEKKIGLHRIDLKRRGFYGHFPEKKKEGVVRIGCFGDSNVAGDEIGELLDYPYLLSDIFKKNGYANVEVLNFGIPAAGFHQIFMLWEEAGRHYDLDYIVLGPTLFWPDRETTFNWIVSYMPVANLCHPRYILDSDGNGVKRIVLEGHTVQEIINDYFGFTTSWKYLRYDRNFPAALRMPLHVFFPGRQFKNIFYYHGNIDVEALRIEELLLKKMIAFGKPVLLVYCDWGNGAKIANTVSAVNFSSESVEHFKRFPYRTPYGHNSPSANYILAKRIYAMLSNKPDTHLSVLGTCDADGTEEAGDVLYKMPLDHYEEIRWEIDGYVLGYFYDIQDNSKRNENYCRDGRCDRRKTARVSCVSLLAFADSKKSIIDALFLCVPFELSNGMPVEIKIYGADNFQLKHQLSLPVKNLNIGRVYKDLIGGFSDNVLLFQDILGHELHDGDGIKLFVDGKLVLAGVFKKAGGQFYLNISEGKWMIIRSKGDALLDVDNMPQSGNIYLYLKENKRKFRVPIIRWFMNKQAPKIKEHGR